MTAPPLKGTGRTEGAAGAGLGRVLLMGPSFSGKTFISGRLRELGLPAFDSDAVSGLSIWVDEQGTAVRSPQELTREWTSRHRFVWSPEFLERWLSAQEDVLLFGHSQNAADLASLFDRVVYLYLSAAQLEQRFQHNERRNPFGQTPEQQEMIRGARRLVLSRALKRGWELLPAAAAPSLVLATLRGQAAPLDPRLIALAEGLEPPALPAILSGRQAVAEPPVATAADDVRAASL